MSDLTPREQLAELLAARQRCCPSPGRAQADADAVIDAGWRSPPQRPPAGYIVGWQEGDGRVWIALDESEIPPGLSGPDRVAFRELVDARLFAAELGPEDPDTTFRVYGLHEVADETEPADVVTVPFETLLDVFLDGFGTGVNSALAEISPFPQGMVEAETRRTIAEFKTDPLAVEELREHIRRRLSGDIDDTATEAPVWGGGE